MTSSFFGDDVISDDFDDVITTSKMSESFWISYAYFYRQNEQSCQFLRKSVRRKCIFWKTSDMTSFYDIISDDFQKIHFLRSDFSNSWYDFSFWRYKLTEKNSERFRHFWRRYDVIIFCRWRHFRRFWWRHNDVKNVGIVLNFFLWTCIVKMNNRANFYENRFGGSVFSNQIKSNIFSAISKY